MDSAGDGKEGMDIRMSVTLFARELTPVITMTMPESVNGIAILTAVSEAMSQVQGRGTYSYKVFEDLLSQRTSLLDRGVGDDGKHLNILFVTDAEPYILGGSRICKELVASYGAPFTGRGRLTPEVCGTLLHEKLLDDFREVFPQARIWGYSPTRLPQSFVQSTFNSLYYTDESSSSADIEAWQVNMNDAMCNNAEITTNAPTTPTSSPTSPTRAPTDFPTSKPSTGRPSKSPTTGRPSTAYPTVKPTTGRPSKAPTGYPTGRPSTGRPTKSR